MDINHFTERFKDLRVLVAGEIGIDEYIVGECRRISPEAPVPVVEVESQSMRLGLSGNVAQNVASLGAAVEFVGVVGADADAGLLQKMLGEAGVTPHLLTDDSRPTSRKVRVIAQKQHLVRIDFERSHRLEPVLAQQFQKTVLDRLSQCDVLIIQDYGKGIWCTDTVSVIREARKIGKGVYVDPSRRTALAWYRGATLLTPNMAEAEVLCRVAHTPPRNLGPDDQALERLAKQILDVTEADHSIITCGEWGMVSMEAKTNHFRRIPTFARDVFDVTGAGDTVIAVIALMHASGATIDQCMRVSNAAAGLVVGRLGASCITRTELEGEVSRLKQLGF